MSYSFKRAVGLAVGMYFTSFVIGLVAGMATGQDMSSMENITDVMWYVGMAVSVVLAVLFTLWYFRNPTLIPSAKSGLLFGLTAIVVSIGLDVVFCLIAKASGVTMDLMKYYSDYRFWITVVLVLLMTVVVGVKKAPKLPSFPSQPQL